MFVLTGIRLRWHCPPSPAEDRVSEFEDATERCCESLLHGKSTRVNDRVDGEIAASGTTGGRCRRLTADSSIELLKRLMLSTRFEVERLNYAQATGAGLITS